jgi:hypothetical protein
VDKFEPAAFAELTQTVLRNHLSSDDFVHDAGLRWAQDAARRLPIGCDTQDAIYSIIKRAARYAIDLEKATTAEYGARRS